MLKILQVLRLGLIYGLVILIGASGLMLLNTQKTSAAKKSLPDSNTEKINFEKPAGLVKDGIYYPGQKLNWFFSFGAAESSWAEIGDLDPNFPAKIDLTADASGVWQLQSPAFSKALNVGPHLVKVFVSDTADRVFEQNVKVVLKNLPSITALSLKPVKENSVMATWENVGIADSFLLSWRDLSGETVGSAVVSGKLNTFQIKNLKPATGYEITVWPLFESQKGISIRQNVRTLSVVSPSKQVAESKKQIASVTPVTPAIGEGVSTSSPQVIRRPVQTVAGSTQDAVEKKTAEVSPTPSTSPSPAATETQSGGWNKLLVALSILVIAAGAAIGGYYGYEWLMLKSKEDEDEPPTKSSSRW